MCRTNEFLEGFCKLRLRWRAKVDFSMFFFCHQVVLADSKLYSIFCVDIYIYLKHDKNNWNLMLLFFLILTLQLSKSRLGCKYTTGAWTGETDVLTTHFSSVLFVLFSIFPTFFPATLYDDSYVPSFSIFNLILVFLACKRSRGRHRFSLVISCRTDEKTKTPVRNIFNLYSVINQSGTELWNV